jgi:hypothetical protein
LQGRRIPRDSGLPEQQPRGQAAPRVTPFARQMAFKFCALVLPRR